MRLYSPARYDGLPGMPFPASPWAFPTKDDVGTTWRSTPPSSRYRSRAALSCDVLRRKVTGTSSTRTAGH
jgi:putative flavoprotein involved in K+ transport